MPPIISKQRAAAVARPGGGSVVDRITTMHFDEDEGISILLYGRSGTGKTTLWGSFPGPILAMICSGGKRPGELRSLFTPDLIAKIKTVTLQHSTDVAALADHQARTLTYKTIVLDHVSGLQDLTLKEILGLEHLPEQKTFGLAKKQEWGQSTAMCKELIRKLLDLSCNVVIIGQEREDKPGEDGDNEITNPSIGVAVTPSLAGWLNPAVDYVCQTVIRPVMVTKETKVGTGPNAPTIKTLSRGKGVEFALRTEPHDIYTTKFRVPKGRALPDFIVDPSYEKIMAVIRGT